MIDMRPSIEPKTDQLNADDLIAGELIITVAQVTQGGRDQPISIHHNMGQPWKPCKTMRRILVTAWGVDGQAYAGRSIKLYRDNSVKYAGIEVGGIRIRALSHIDNIIQMPITIARGKRAPYRVDVLPVIQQDSAGDLFAIAEAEAKKGGVAYRAFFQGLTSEQKKQIQPIHEGLKALSNNGN